MPFPKLDGVSVLVTGGAGFIGSNFVRQMLAETEDTIVNFDLLTYAGNLDTLDSLRGDDRHVFVQGDIADSERVSRLISEYQPSAIVNFAAASHVDRSIDGPPAFVQTNVVGTLNMLQCALDWWKTLPADDRAGFRFLQVSTDEVYGSLGPQGEFTEDSPLQPNNPYSASKAGADMLCRAYFVTHKLPVTMTRCSNNYGPRQFPEKLIPLVILKAVAGEPLPVYGDGGNIRDWLFVTDHCAAIERVLAAGQPGETYNVGGDAERRNIEVVRAICQLVDARVPRPDGKPRESQVTFVTDRPGHDKRYAIDAAKLETELGWKAQENFDTGIRRTIQWYLDNDWWWRPIREGRYAGERLGRA